MIEYTDSDIGLLHDIVNNARQLLVSQAEMTILPPGVCTRFVNRRLSTMLANIDQILNDGVIVPPKALNDDWVEGPNISSWEVKLNLAKGALMFYANESNYDWDVNGDGVGVMVVETDHGEIANETLEALK